MRVTTTKLIIVILFSLTDYFMAGLLYDPSSNSNFLIPIIKHLAIIVSITCLACIVIIFYSKKRTKDFLGIYDNEKQGKKRSVKHSGKNVIEWPRSK